MWLYDMKDNLVSYGFVTLLDSENPNNDPHLEAQKFKTHPWMRGCSRARELVRYGAKAIPTGGLYAQPKLYIDGALLVGDSAGFCNAQKLSGVHMAMKSGMLAAETLVDALAQQDFSVEDARRLRRALPPELGLRRSTTRRATSAARSSAGIAFFFLNEPIRMILTGGRGLRRPAATEAGHTAHEAALRAAAGASARKEKFEFDGKLTFSKEHLVQFSGTQHEVDQPSHLVVADTDLCSDDLRRGVRQPLRELLPGGRLRDDPRPGAPRDARSCFIHHENCVHCKTCDIADPVPGDHLDAARGRRGARLHADVALRRGARRRRAPPPARRARSAPAATSSARAGASIASREGARRPRPRTQRARLGGDQRADAPADRDALPRAWRDAQARRRRPGTSGATAIAPPQAGADLEARRRSRLAARLRQIVRDVARARPVAAARTGARRRLARRARCAAPPRTASR